MPGSGVNATNILEIAQLTGASEFHSSASVYKQGHMEFINPAMAEDMSHITVDSDAVKKMVTLLKNIQSPFQQ